MKHFLLSLLIVSFQIGLYSQSEFDISKFSKAEKRTIISIEQKLIDKGGISIKDSNGEKTLIPDYCIKLSKRNKRSLEKMSTKEKLELLRHENAIINVFGFQFLAKDKNNRQIVIQEFDKLIELETVHYKNKYVSVSCENSYNIQTQAELCLLLIEDNSKFCTECIKLSKSEIEKYRTILKEKFKGVEG